MRLNQTQTNLLTKLAKVSARSMNIMGDIIADTPDDTQLVMLEDEALSLALFIREYRRPKNIVEKKGQRA